MNGKHRRVSDTVPNGIGEYAGKHVRRSYSPVFDFTEDDEIYILRRLNNLGKKIKRLWYTPKHLEEDPEDWI